MGWWVGVGLVGGCWVGGGVLGWGGVDGVWVGGVLVGWWVGGVLVSWCVDMLTCWYVGHLPKHAAAVASLGRAEGLAHVDGHAEERRHGRLHVVGS